MPPRRLLASAALGLGAVWALPAEPHYFEQLVDHFTSSTATYRQRYYLDDTHFGGPGSPIFVILGGEGGVPPETGIFYPWISQDLAKQFRALVLEPEHRFYGASLPFGETASFLPENLALLTSQQALADAAHFIRWHQRQRNCTARGTPGYCPVLTVGGSYPGFLSAMMRLRYPAVVDMAYAASAPMRFYTQEVEQYDYYARVTESAEKSLPGCSAAALLAFEQLQDFLSRASVEEIAAELSVCGGSFRERDLADNLLFLLEQTFANLNMANYPPDNRTAMYRTCSDLVAARAKGGQEPMRALGRLLHTYTSTSAARRSTFALGELRGDAVAANGCFNMTANIPAGEHATARCGDWSGCGSGRDGEMWDYQTCTFEVEKIGFGTARQMFPARPWTHEWLAEHCKRRFGVTPQPRGLTELWGFEETELAAQASRILFTNGLNDGWSVGGFPADVAPARGLVTINLKDGAHHSDLGHGVDETAEVKEVHDRAKQLVAAWIAEVKPKQEVVV